MAKIFIVIENVGGLVEEVRAFKSKDKAIDIKLEKQQAMRKAPVGDFIYTMDEVELEE